MATLGDIAQHVLGNTILAQLMTRYPAPTASLAGRTYIVTGANSGLGFALAVHLARLGAARVVLAVRDAAKGHAARAAIVRETGCPPEILDVWDLDMARFASVAFQVNALSTGLLAVLLLPVLQKTARLLPLPDTEHVPPHLTITGSGGAYLAPPIYSDSKWRSRPGQNVAKFPERLAPADGILSALNDPAKFNAFDRYPTSKLFSYFIAQKAALLPQADGVVVNVVDPGLDQSDPEPNQKEETGREADEELMAITVLQICL
ncbi:hypothetical protein GGX14DRAFT_632747 [Mycena pura]|uniref:Ketoreductase (KR) domain-containing protein n=1 Tax=Mycena pura TaxID=153505 RepID=A0AAD6YGM7_9AGAR|nr:hypothetical protein GGX14DRAFT_632747 [Mycena pura]